MRPTSLMFSMLLTLGACGGSNSGDPGADAPSDPTLRYNPWQVGAIWSYKLTDSNNPANVALDKLTTIMGEEDVGGVHAGKLAFKVHVEQLNGSKDVWETHYGDFDVRYKSTFYDNLAQLTGTDIDQPYRLKLDESYAHTQPNAQWSESFTETSTGAAPATKTEQWHVLSNTEQVTVMAGTYTTLHIQRTSSGGTLQDYWYARGVGKVKETGGGQIEELISYTPGQ